MAHFSPHTASQSQPHAPVLELLDIVMQGHHGQQLAYGDLAVPPAPFALLVAEAFDRGMHPSGWAGLMRPGGDPRLHATLLQIWASEVWPQFVARCRAA